jgi:uncharacterized membrane protein
VRGVPATSSSAAAAFVFRLTGPPPGNITQPGPLVIVASAAVAICALVLAGVSGCAACREPSVAGCPEA